MKKTKVLFINLTTFLSFNGLLSIAAYCKKYVDGVDFNIVSLIDGKVERNAKFKFNVNILDSLPFVPDIIGISCLLVTKREKIVIQELKKKFPTAFLILGGYSTQKRYSRKIINKYFDAGCYGEGEIPFKEFLLAYKENKHLEYLKNSEQWITKNDDKNKIIKPNYITNLDDIPTYDLSILLNYNNPKNTLYLIFDRGCYNHCAFCNLGRKSGEWVHLSSERIKNDILEYSNKYGYNNFAIDSDAVFNDKEHWLEIINFFKENKQINLLSLGLFLVEYLDEEILILLKEALPNFGNLHLSLDGCSERMYKILKGNTKIPLKKYTEIIQLAKKQDITTTFQTIIGFPGEKLTESIFAAKFLYSLGIQNSVFSPFYYLPNSPIYKKNKPTLIQEKLTFLKSSILAEIAMFVSMKYCDYYKNKEYEMLLRSSSRNDNNFIVSSFYIYFSLMNCPNLDSKKIFVYLERLNNNLKSTSLFDIFFFFLLKRDFKFFLYCLKVKFFTK